MSRRCGPVLTIVEPASEQAICDFAAAGIAQLAAVNNFKTVSDLRFDRSVGRKLLCRAASEQSGAEARYFADLCAALISDAALDRERTRVEPTPLAYPSVATSNFLKNFIALCNAELPEKRGRDPTYPKGEAACIAQALFAPWQRRDRPNVCVGTRRKRNGMPTSGARPLRIRRRPSTGQIGWPSSGCQP